MRALFFTYLFAIVAVASSPPSTERSNVLVKRTCDNIECGIDAMNAGYDCAKAVAIGEIDWLDDLLCLAEVAEFAAELHSGPCDTCINELQDALKDVVDSVNKHLKPYTQYYTYQDIYSTMSGLFTSNFQGLTVWVTASPAWPTNTINSPPPMSSSGVPQPTNVYPTSWGGPSWNPSPTYPAPGPSQTYGGPQPTYGGPQPTYGGPQPTYGGPPPTYGGPAPTYGGPQPTYGGPAPTYGGPQPTYGGPAPTYGGGGGGGYYPPPYYGGGGGGGGSYYYKLRPRTIGPSGFKSVTIRLPDN